MCFGATRTHARVTMIDKQKTPMSFDGAQVITATGLITIADAGTLELNEAGGVLDMDRNSNEGDEAYRKRLTEEVVHQNQKWEQRWGRVRTRQR